MSSAAAVANVCRPPSCATMRRTVTTAATRPPVHPSPAAPHPSSATTPFASHACGLATVMPTAPTARTSGPRTVVPRNLTPLWLITARPWSSAVAAESASMEAGSAMEELTASIDLTKLTVVRNVGQCFFFCWSHVVTAVFISCAFVHFLLVSSSHLPSWWVWMRWWHLHPWKPPVQPPIWLQGHEWWDWLRQRYKSPLPFLSWSPVRTAELIVSVYN